MHTMEDATVGLCMHLMRARLLEYAAEIEAGERRPKESLLTCLAELAAAIQASKKRTGIIAPRKFIHRLRNDNALQSSKCSSSGPVPAHPPRTPLVVCSDARTPEAGRASILV